MTTIDALRERPPKTESRKANKTLAPKEMSRDAEDVKWPNGMQASKREKLSRLSEIFFLTMRGVSARARNV